MAVSGTEPISAENLGAVLSGAGYPLMEVLYTGSREWQVTLPRPVTDYALLFVTVELQNDTAAVTVMPGSGETYFAFESSSGKVLCAQISGSQSIMTDTRGEIHQIIAIR